MKTIIILLSLVAIFSYGCKEEAGKDSKIRTANTIPSVIVIDNKKNVAPLPVREVHTGFQMRTTFVFELPGNKVDSTNASC